MAPCMQHTTDENQRREIVRVASVADACIVDFHAKVSLFTNAVVIIYKRHEYLLELHMTEEKPHVRFLPVRDGCLVPWPRAAGLDTVMSRPLMMCSP